MVSCGVLCWTTKEVAKRASLRKDDGFHSARYRCHCGEKADKLQCECQQATRPAGLWIITCSPKVFEVSAL